MVNSTKNKKVSTLMTSKSLGRLVSTL